MDLRNVRDRWLQAKTDRNGTVGLEDPPFLELPEFAD